MARAGDMISCIQSEEKERKLSPILLSVIFAVPQQCVMPR